MQIYISALEKDLAYESVGPIYHDSVTKRKEKIITVSKHSLNLEYL